jgi:hypothetical protein
LFLPQELDIDTRVSLVRKTMLVASLCACSPNEWYLKNRVAAIRWRIAFVGASGASSDIILNTSFLHRTVHGSQSA